MARMIRQAMPHINTLVSYGDTSEHNGAISRGGRLPDGRDHARQGLTHADRTADGRDCCRQDPLAGPAPSNFLTREDPSKIAIGRLTYS